MKQSEDILIGEAKKYYVRDNEEKLVEDDLKRYQEERTSLMHGTVHFEKYPDLVQVKENDELQAFFSQFEKEDE